MTESLLAALMTVVQPYNIAVMFFGTLIGILVGAMPGLSSVMGLSIMMPLTLSMEGNSGVLMLLGIFCGAIYGGAITAHLLQTPRTPHPPPRGSPAKSFPQKAAPPLSDQR